MNIYSQCKVKQPGSVSIVQQLTRWNVEAETGGGEHNEILWSHHSHSVVMCDNICWVDKLIYSDSPANMNDLYSTTCIGKNSVMSNIEELGYFKVYAVGVPRMLSDVHKTARKAAVTDFCVYMTQECNVSKKIMAAVFWNCWIYSAVAALTLHPQTWHAISFSPVSSFERPSLKTTFHGWCSTVEDQVPVAVGEHTHSCSKMEEYHWQKWRILWKLTVFSAML